ncbi:MAG: class I poly(R)-hydroxyalkanoic acid synthase, partial [Burkholderiales bacterium]|nr:class I poly(R)-hydroxyalkanoic acid synthase [Burkholderiales bacterium]
MQRMFEAWMGAWRSFADPSKWPAAAQAAQAAHIQGMAPQAENGNAGGAAFPFSFPFAMPPMPAGGFPAMGLPPMMADARQAFAGMQLPAASIPPERLSRLQADYSRDCLALLQQASAADKPPPELPDRRFSADAWKATPAFAYTAAWYLLNARYLQALADALDTDAKTRERIRFAVQQWTAAASPSNFLALNPEAQKTLLESHGESL